MRIYKCRNRLISRSYHIQNYRKLYRQYLSRQFKEMVRSIIISLSSLIKKFYSILFFKPFQVTLHSSFITLLSFIRNYHSNYSVLCSINFFQKKIFLFLFEAREEFTNKKFPTNVFWLVPPLNSL
jgi:hypothetical protein